MPCRFQLFVSGGMEMLLYLGLRFVIDHEDHGALGGLCFLRRGQIRFSLGVVRGRRSRQAFERRVVKSLGGDRSRMSRRISSRTWRGLHITGVSGTRAYGMASAPWQSSNWVASIEASASRCTSRTVRPLSLIVFSVCL